MGDHAGIEQTHRRGSEDRTRSFTRWMWALALASLPRARVRYGRLNQGDGTVSRVDAKTGKLIANIEVGVPGTGGEIAFGAGHVWATVFEIPISEIDPATNTVVKQWFGPGGDSIRVAHGSVWLSNLRDGNVWRFSPDQP